METMKFREKKKKYTLQIFCLSSFLVIGIGFTIFGICNEKKPMKIGTDVSNLEFQKQLDEDVNALVNIYENGNDEKKEDIDLNKMVTITNKIFSNKKDDKVNASIKVPIISINNSTLDSLNDSIYESFNKKYIDFKEAMKEVKNTFTYDVDYVYYLNSINDKNVLSIVIHEQMIDNKSKKVSKDNKYTYNIDIDTRKKILQEELTDDILGSNYKEIIKDKINKTLIENKVLSKDDIMYSYTELEPYYIKDKKFHIIFNPSDVNDKLNKIIDIEMEKE